MKKLKIEYGDSVFALPREGLAEVVAGASGFNLKVLLLVAADDMLRRDYAACCAELCRRLDCTQSALEKAMTFWKNAGVMYVAEAVDAPATAADAPKPEKKLQSSALPVYTECQTAGIIERNPDLAGVIHLCQDITGKMFTSGEVEIVIGLFDHLGLDGEYIVTLFQYCKSIEKKSPRYIEKMAISLFDEGIDTVAALNDYIRRREQKQSNLDTICKLIGAVGRQLTPNERKKFDCWLDEWQLDIGVITCAYEVTVDKLGEPKLAYMNKVLENWHKEGLTTVEAVQASLEIYKKNKAEAEQNSSGFETNEFFEAAVSRGLKYGEN